MRKDSWFLEATSLAVVAISLIISAPCARGQAPAYFGALLYSKPNATLVPPLYPGQPSTVTTAYLWLDDLMRLDNEGQILAYIRSMSVWNDTMQNIASYLYQIQDDNPLTYYNWNGAGI